MSETETTTSSPPGDDLRAVLQQSWDEAQARADAEEAPRETPAESTPQETERTRDERGRFVAREPAANGAAAETPTETTDQPEAKADEPASQAIAPPQSWSDAEKAVWGNLSREAQETVLRRERDYERGMAERATEQRSVAALREAVEPYRAMIAMEGLSDADAVRRLLAAQDMLKRDPDRAFPELMRAFGYDPRRLLNSPSTQAQPQGQQFRDPRVDELLTSIQQRDQQAALSAVDAFSRDPNHPHFGDVRDHMGMLLSSGAARTLDEAYEQAVWANPAVRERMLAERARADAAQRDTEAKQRAEAARRASVSVTGRAPPGQSQGTAPAATWREEIERAWADASR